MAKLVYICYRNSKSDPMFDKKANLLANRLTPDNIPNPHPQVIIGNGVHIAVFNPTHVLPIVDISVCMGALIDPGDDWWKPTSSIPDGSYALFRSDERTIELVTDVVASRTIWYVHTPEMFVASTSQRAVIFFLQDFLPNETAQAWMLSSGTLGPGLSWDRRIRCLPGNARLLLDRSTWKTEILKEPVIFSSQDLSYEKHEEMLMGAIKDTFDNLHIHPNDWVITLSGGYDSRAILLFLKNKINPKCITWGLQSSLNQKRNDAYIAKCLAESLKCEHEYWHTDLSDDSIKVLFNRFLIAGEGRIDAIPAYMDGFSIWKKLYESDYQGIIRGDEALGCLQVSNAKEVNNNMGLILCSDYAKLESFAQIASLYNQNRPNFLRQRTDENLANWRDRLNIQFEIPYKFAALNDLKLSYVEVMNPLLSRKIIEKVKRLPGNLRTNKMLFKGIVKSMSPDIPFAKSRAIDTQREILRTHRVVNYLSNEISTHDVRSLFQDDLIDLILPNLKINAPGNLALVSKIKSNFRKAQNRIKNKISTFRNIQAIDYNILAFRIFIISKMKRLLLSDSTAIKKKL